MEISNPHCRCKIVDANKGAYVHALELKLKFSPTYYYQAVYTFYPTGVYYISSRRILCFEAHEVEANVLQSFLLSM